MTPSEAVTVADPVESPLHSTWLLSSTLHTSSSGSVIIISQVVSQSKLSVTVTVCKPAVKFTAVAVVSPLSHK